jgi:hypothetical protein
MLKISLFMAVLGQAVSMLAAMPPMPEELAPAPAAATDWYQPGSEVHSTLREALAQARISSWLAPRLQNGQPVPQASARMLARDLYDNPNVSEDLKARLKSLLPSEVSQFDDHSPANAAEIARLKSQIDAMQLKLDAVTETMFKNVYNRGSFPGMSGSMNLGYLSRTGAGLSLDGTSTFGYTGFNAQDFESVIRWAFEGTVPGGNFRLDMAVLYGSEEGAGLIGKKAYDAVPRLGGAELNLGNVQLRYGMHLNYNLSALVFGGISSADSNLFYRSAGDIWSAMTLMPVNSGDGPGSQYLVLRKQGMASWWWPFIDTQFVYSPNQQFYLTSNPKVYTYAGRVDLSPIEAGFINSLKPYVTGESSYQDLAQMRSFDAAADSALRQNTYAYAGGMDMALGNGSTVLTEGAVSRWASSDQTEEKTGSAYFATATIPVGNFTLVAQGYELSPYFLTGTIDPFASFSQKRLGQNLVTGAYYDTVMNDYERQGGKTNVLSHQSILRKSDGMSNNSRSYSLKTQAQFSWVTLGLTYKVAQDIEPSGPWMQSQFIVNGLYYNGGLDGWYERMGAGWGPYTPNSPKGDRQLAFLTPTAAPAYNNGTKFADGDGNTYTANYWQQVTQMTYAETQTFVLLSRNGLGDNRARPDSIKYTGVIKGNMLVDLGPLLNREYPAQLQLTSELRNLSEDPAFPSYTDTVLLSQVASQASLRWGLSQTVDFLSGAGYETWLSRASLYPVDYFCVFYGAGFDFKLDELLSTMVVSLRGEDFNFHDPNFPTRDYSAWTWKLGTGVKF